jgi:hypothetical protein
MRWRWPAARRGGARIRTGGLHGGARVFWGMHWLEPLVEWTDRALAPPRPATSPRSSIGSSGKAIGRIADHPFIARQQRLTFARAGRTRPLSLEDYAASGGWAGLERARSMAPADVVAEVIDSGLRGRGGAGFPGGDQVEDRCRGAGFANTSSATPTRATAAPLPTGC